LNVSALVVYVPTMRRRTSSFTSINIFCFTLFMYAAKNCPRRSDRSCSRNASRACLNFSGEFGGGASAISARLDVADPT
jgi:hypothetical protein